MSNQYVQFCSVIAHLTKKEKRWLEAALGPIDRAPSWPTIAKLEREGVDSLSWPDFDYRFYRDDDEGECLEVSSEECGDVHSVTVLFQMFLKVRNDGRYLTLNWASTSSRPEAGQNGGGAVFITPQSIKSLNTGVWLDEQARRWLEARRWRKKHEDHDAQQPSSRRPSHQGTRGRKPYRQARHRKT